MINQNQNNAQIPTYQGNSQGHSGRVSYPESTAREQASLNVL